MLLYKLGHLILLSAIPIQNIKQQYNVDVASVARYSNMFLIWMLLHGPGSTSIWSASLGYIIGWCHMAHLTICCFTNVVFFIDTSEWIFTKHDIYQPETENLNEIFWVSILPQKLGAQKLHPYCCTHAMNRKYVQHQPSHWSTLRCTNISNLRLTSQAGLRVWWCPICLMVPCITCNYYRISSRDVMAVNKRLWIIYTVLHLHLPSVLWCCWLGGRKGIRAVKNMERWGAGVVICLEQGANDLHMVQLMPLSPSHLLLQQNPEWFIFLVLTYPVCLQCFDAVGWVPGRVSGP